MLVLCESPKCSIWTAHSVSSHNICNIYTISILKCILTWSYAYIVPICFLLFNATNCSYTQKQNTRVRCPIAHDYFHNRLQHLTFLFICSQRLIRHTISPTCVKFVWLGKKILQANILILTKLCIFRVYFLQTAILKTKAYINSSTKFEHNSA